jgi:carbon monoxide dehydrogenase subunit G
MPLTTMGPTPLRADAAEAAQIGAASTEAAIGSATALAADGTTPSTDLSGHTDYREHPRQGAGQASRPHRGDSNDDNRDEVSGMRLEHEFTVPVSVPEAWRLLLDVQRFVPCLPGAAVDSGDGDEVVGRVKVKVGPVTASYHGTAKFVEKDETARRFVLEASGREIRGVGTANATVTVQLHEEDSSTRVTVTTDLDITGKPAQFGRGVMTNVVDNLITQFAFCLAAEVAAPQVAEQAGAAQQSAPHQSTPQLVGASSDSTESDSIDLLGTVGPPVLTRLAPVLVTVVLVAVVWLVGRRSPSQIVVHVHVPSRPGASP